MDLRRGAGQLIVVFGYIVLTDCADEVHNATLNATSSTIPSLYGDVHNNTLDDRALTGITSADGIRNRSAVSEQGNVTNKVPLDDNLTESTTAPLNVHQATNKR